MAFERQPVSINPRIPRLYGFTVFRSPLALPFTFHFRRDRAIDDPVKVESKRINSLSELFVDSYRHVALVGGVDTNMFHRRRMELLAFRVNIPLRFGVPGPMLLVRKWRRLCAPY